MTTFTQVAQRHSAVGIDTDPRDAAVVETHAQPGFRRKLQNPETSTYVYMYM